MKDIRYLLTAWGNWSGSRIGTEYKSAWPIATASSDIRPMLSDADGEIVDRAVSGLKQFDELSYDILVAHYCGKLSCRVIGKAMNKNYKYVYDSLSRSEFYISGCVNEIMCAA